MGRQVLWTGGIGDILTLESWWDDDYRRNVTRMYWASRVQKAMAPLFTRLPSYGYLRDHVWLWEMWETRDGEPLTFRDYEHVYEATLNRHLITGPIEDWSIAKRFLEPEAFKGSSFVKHKLASVDHFELPSQYAVVCPYSVQNRKATREWRRFRDRDWAWCLKRLHKLKVKGVVLTTGDDPVPDDPALINLANRTTLAEAIEITKGAGWYIGIDTGFSVIAAQVLPRDRLFVSTLNVILWNFRKVYYAPQTQFDFIVPYLGATKQEARSWRAESERMAPPILATG